MKQIVLHTGFLLGGLFLLHGCHTAPGDVAVRITTSAGKITATVDTVKAPVTAKNFLALVDAGTYNRGATFYRVVRPDNQPGSKVKIEVIQGGLRSDSLAGALPPIMHETTEKTGLLHFDGTLSMARNEPGSASSEFFICVGPQPELDFAGARNLDGQGFAAFGQVAEGIEVVHKIQQMPDSAQMLITPIQIISIERIR